MIYIQTYNESLRDKMVAKSDNEIKKVIKKLPKNDRFDKYLQFQDWEHIKKISSGFNRLSQNQKNIVLQKGSTAGNLDIVKHIIRKGAEIDYFHGTSIRGAALEGHIDIVKYLIEKGSHNGEVALEKAAYGGHLDIVKYLIEIGYDDYGLAMRNASSNGYIDIVKYLLDKGYRDYYSIQAAEDSEHMEIVDLLKSYSFKKNGDESESLRDKII